MVFYEGILFDHNSLLIRASVNESVLHGVLKKPNMDFTTCKADIDTIVAEPVVSV